MKKKSFQYCLSLLKLKLTALLFLISFISSLSFASNPNSKNTELPSNSEYQQQNTITGVVADSDGNPIPGANVVVKGTTKGTITDIDGIYELTNVSQDDVLVFSFIGMLSEEVLVGDQSKIDVVLIEDIQALDEVVVIGYGTTTRKNFTGSVSKVDFEDSPLSLNSATNAMDLLRGITTGVNFSQSGEVGATPDIMVRGQKSVNGGSEPLYVVDGVIFSGTLNDIDPSIIESISVLKDATTLAAYGSKAANGVIMIELKEGQKGKPIITYNGSYSMSSPTFKPQYLDGDGYIRLMNARSGYDSDSDPSSWMGALEQTNYAAGEETDWFDYVTRTGMMQNHALSFSGASESSSYFLSAGNINQKGNYYGDEYKRTTFSANINSTINDYIKIGANSNLAYNNFDGVIASQQVNFSPWAEPYLLNGNLRKYIDGREATTENPLWNTENMDDYNRSQTSVLGGYLELKAPFLEGLSYKITGSYTKNSDEARSFEHETSYPDINLSDDGYTTEIFDQSLALATGSVTAYKSSSWVIDNILSYTKQINDHFFNASLVYTRNSTLVEGSYFAGTNFSGIGNTTLGYYGLGNAENQKVNNISYTLHNDIGYLGRVSYSLKNKYHINASLRRDGSSVFGADKKWGNFPAIGGAWSISEESFMQNLSFIDDLKLKVSWGKNGNQSLDPYGTLSTVAMGQGGEKVYFFNDVAYAQTVETLGNPGLAWETTTAVNFGFEAEMFKGRLNLDFNGYKSQTTDQIFDRTIPVMGAGLTTQKATMGQVDNWGIEIEATSLNVSTSNFSWNSRLTFSLNRNELVDLYGDGQDDITNLLFIGKSLGAIYGYKTEGIVQEGEEDYFSNLTAIAGDAKYVDTNGDGALTADDRTILGYNKENFRMSLANTLKYKQIELYFLLNGVFSGNDYGMANNVSYYLTGASMFYRNGPDHEWWTAENKSNEYPIFSYSDSRYQPIHSYGFIRLQDVSLSYTFKQTLLDKAKINGLKVYVSASNLFFFAPDWKGSDPEARSTVEGLSSTPITQLSRMITFGVNLKL